MKGYGKNSYSIQNGIIIQNSPPYQPLEGRTLKLNDNPIMILLGLILVGLGIGLFFGFRFSLDNQSMLIAVFILAAILMLLVVIGRVKESVGVIFTALWLVLVGLLARFNLVFPYSDLAVSLMPIAAGAFMMIGL